MALPRIVLPKWMGRIGAKLSGKPPRLVLMSALNAMLKKRLLPADMELFAGGRLKIEALDAGIAVRFSADNQEFADDNFSGMLDLRLTANGIDFIYVVMREEDPDTLFFSHELQAEGDTELGLIIKNLLNSVDWPFGGWFLNKGASSQRLGTYRPRPSEAFSGGLVTIKDAVFAVVATNRPYTT